MNSNLSHYKTLGVINRTPNSFSDPGLSLNPDYFKAQLQSFLNDSTVIIDVGFESTAPMNQAISFEEEKNRFQIFLEASKTFSFFNRYVSFDTYKIKNFKFMVHEFKKYHPKANFIFNDVSGVLDDELMEALFEFKHTKFYYIYTFSHIPKREQTLEHMNFLETKVDIIESCAQAFMKASEWFKSIEMEHQLILDPGFGFSKTFDQNWKLIHHFRDLEEKLLDLKITNPILIGLSKKSFLRKVAAADSPLALEELHQRCIQDISKNSILNLLFRVHDPSIIKILKTL